MRLDPRADKTADKKRARNGRDAGDFHLPRRQFDHEQHNEPLQSTACPRLDGEEVGGDDQVPMLLEEFLPGGLSFPLRSRLNSVPRQDRGDRAATNVVPQIGKRTLDSPIAPSAVVNGVWAK